MDTTATTGDTTERSVAPCPWTARRDTQSTPTDSMPRPHRRSPHRVALCGVVLALGCVWSCLDDNALDDLGLGQLDPPSGRCPHGEFEGICLPSWPQIEDWHCPEGWRSLSGLTDSGGRENTPQAMVPFTACEPPPWPDDCPLGWMPRLSQSECVRQGAECPGGGDGWHDEETIRGLAPGHEGRIIYVSPQGSSAGDGSSEAPLGRIEEALAMAGSGGIVALSAGEFAEAVVLDGSSAVVGSCVEATTIVAPSASETEPTVMFSGAAARAQLSDLSVTGERIGVEFRGTVEPNLLMAVAVREAHRAAPRRREAAADVSCKTYD